MEEIQKLQALVLAQQIALCDHEDLLAKYKHVRAKYDSLRACTNSESEPAGKCDLCGMWFNLYYTHGCEDCDRSACVESCSVRCCSCYFYSCKDCKVECNSCDQFFCGLCAQVWVAANGICPDCVE